MTEKRYGDYKEKLTEEDLQRTQRYLDDAGLTDEWDKELEEIRAKKREAIIPPEGTYRCTKCGKMGFEPIRWEEKPRDEFTVKCPYCHASDEKLEVFYQGRWQCAVQRMMPTQEELAMREAYYQNVFSKLKAGNIYMQTDYRKVQ